MKKTLYIHIGRHKTGTSSLQVFLHENTELLAKENILYPLTSRDREGRVVRIAHHEFSMAIKKNNIAKVSEYKKRLAQESSTFDRIILSSEDFQNITDLSLLAETFNNYKIVPICYLREVLGYAASSYAQRVQNTNEVYDFVSFAKTQNINLNLFIQRWKSLSRYAKFRLYERTKLKNGDIVDDFLHLMKAPKIHFLRPDANANPSISGNLLGLKLLLNMTGHHHAIPYKSFSEATQLDPRFLGKIKVSDVDSALIRERTNYNDVLKSMFGEIKEPSFDDGSEVFDLQKWPMDMALLSTIDEFKNLEVLKVIGSQPKKR